jgi:hypothetical protein
VTKAVDDGDSRGIPLVTTRPRVVEVELQLFGGLVTGNACSQVVLELFDVANQVDVSNDSKDMQVRDRESIWLRASYHVEEP